MEYMNHLFSKSHDNHLIKAHDLNPWQFIYPKPNSHWQHQSSILIGNIKAQFSLAIFKAQFSLAISKTQLTLALLKNPS